MSRLILAIVALAAACVPPALAADTDVTFTVHARETENYTWALFRLWAPEESETVRGVAKAHGLDSITPIEADASNPAELRELLRRHPSDAVVSSLPFYCNPAVAEVAREAGVHYFDLTEDVEVTRKVRAIAAGSDKAFVPQSGLAPGFVSIAANELITHFDRLRSVTLRVGALCRSIPTTCSSTR